MRKINATQKLTLGAMTVALSVLFLFAAGVLPTMKIACIFVSSLFVYVLAGEGAYLSAIIAYAAAGALSFFLLPDKLPALVYIALTGHFGIFKTFINSKQHDKFTGFVLCIVYMNAFFAGALAAAVYIFNYDVASMLKNLPDLPLWLMICIVEAAFITFEILYGFSQRIYDARIRNLILPRR